MYGPRSRYISMIKFRAVHQSHIRTALLRSTLNEDAKMIDAGE